MQDNKNTRKLNKDQLHFDKWEIIAVPAEDGGLESLKYHEKFWALYLIDVL